MRAPQPAISSVIIIALMGGTTAIAALLVVNAAGSLAGPANSLPVWLALIRGMVCVAGAVGMVLRRSWGYWLATAGLVMIAASKCLMMLREGLQWNASVWTLVALFLALEAATRVLGWLDDDDAPQVEGKTIVHDYLNASMSAEHYLDKMVKESPRQAVNNLNLAMKSKKDHVRSGAARRLAAMGTASALPGCLKALASDDYFVRKEAMGGIKTALEGTVDDGFRLGVFAPLAAFLFMEPSTGMLHPEVPSLLLTLDREKAILLLQNESLLTIDSEWLPAILDALIAAEALPDLGKIRSLLSDMESGKCELWHPELAHAAILRALTAAKAPEAEAVLRRVIQEKPTLADKASEMLLGLHGIQPIDVYCKLIDRVEDSGIDSLDEVDRLQNETKTDVPGLDTLLHFYLLEHSDSFTCGACRRKSASKSAM